MDFAAALILIKQGYTVTRPFGARRLVSREWDEQRYPEPGWILQAVTDGVTVPCWMPSQADLFAEDWEVVRP